MVLCANFVLICEIINQNSCKSDFLLTLYFDILGPHDTSGGFWNRSKEVANLGYGHRNRNSHATYKESGSVMFKYSPHSEVLALL